MDRRRTLAAMMLLILVIGSWLLVREEPPVQQPPQASAPDYQVEEVLIKTFDPKGRLTQEIKAEQLIHDPSDNTTEVIQPEVTLIDPSRPPWHIVALRGRVSSQGDQVDLEGDVKIEQMARDGESPVLLETQALQIMPEKSYMESRSQVTITRERSWVKAHGLKAWFNQPSKVTLLSQVRGQYEVK